MSKNMTRKGLAFGAGLTLLGSSLVAALPAHAAIVTSPLFGPSTNYKGAQAFSSGQGGFVVSVNTGLEGATAITGGGDAADTTHWLVEIVNADVTWGDIYGDGSITDTTNDVVFLNGDSSAYATSVSATAVGATTAPLASATSFVVEGGNTVTNNLRINAVYSDGDATTTDDTLKLKVTPFLDLDDDNRNDDGYAGSAATVELIALDGISFTPSFDYTPVGATSITGSTTLNINAEMFAKLSSVGSTLSGATHEHAVSVTSDISGASARTTLVTLTGDATPAANSLEFDVPGLAGANNDIDANGDIVIEVPNGIRSLFVVGNNASLGGSGTITDTAGASTLQGFDLPILAVGAADSGGSGLTAVTLDLSSVTGISVNNEVIISAIANITLTVDTLKLDSANNQFDFTFLAAQVDAISGTTPTAVAAGTYTAMYTVNAAMATIKSASSSAVVGTGAIFTNNADSDVDLVVSAAVASTVALKAETSATVMEDTTLVGGANRVVAKTGTTSLKFNVEVKDSNSVFVGAGRVVNVLLADDSASLGATTITSNGKTLKATGDNSVSFTVTTTSEGIATFTITSDNSAVDGDGEYFNVTVSSEGVSDSLTRVTFQKEAISVVASPESAAKIATGGSIAGTFRVVNQWGQVPTGNYRVHISRTNSSGDRDLTTEQASFVYEVVADSAGRGSFTITDNGDKTVEGTDTVNLKVQKQNTTGGGWADVSGATTSFSLTYEKDLETASLAARANNNGVVLHGTTTKTQPITIEPLSLKAFDGRVDKLSNTKYDVTNTFSTSTLASADGLVAISGEVLTAANAGISNVPVKFSGTGMLFMNQATNTVASSTRFGYQELVVTSGSSGDYTVYVLGNAAGKRTVTISVGSLTKTVDLTFATDGSVADFTVTAASTAEPGRTVDILVAAKDKFGGAAASASVTLSSTGPGYLINTSGTTLSDGTFGTKLLLGSNDTGSAVVKVTMTIDGVSTSKTVTIAVGAAEASATVGSFNGRVAVRVENAKGSTISVKIGRSWYKYSALNNNYLQSWKSTKGASVAVSVYVDGELQNVQTITVK